MQQNECQAQSITTVPNPLPQVSRELCVDAKASWIDTQSRDLDTANAQLVEAHCECPSGKEWKDNGCIESAKQMPPPTSKNILQKAGDYLKDVSSNILLVQNVTTAFLIALVIMGVAIIWLLAQRRR